MPIKVRKMAMLSISSNESLQKLRTDSELIYIYIYMKDQTIIVPYTSIFLFFKGTVWFSVIFQIKMPQTFEKPGASPK